MPKRTPTPRHIDYLPLGEVVPARKNPKLHALADIAESVARFGYIEPVVIDERTGRLLSGHGRLDTLAAGEAAGIDPPDGILVDDDGLWLVPVVRGWRSRNEREAKAALVAVNELTTRGGWDVPELVTMLADIADNAPAGLEGVGFTSRDLAGMLADLNPDDGLNPGADTDPRPKPVDPVTSPGDVWELGDHRLVCGSALDPHVYARLLAGDSAPPAMMWTDPPYGVSVVGGTADALTIDNDDLAHEPMVEFLGRFLANALAVLPAGATIQIAGPGGPASAAFTEVLHRSGVWRQTLVWVKNALVLGRHDYHYRHELVYDAEADGEEPDALLDRDPDFDSVFHGWKPGAGHHRPPRRDLDTLLVFARPARNADHPTMKPVPLVEHGIRHHTDRGEIVLDTFGGSGTTLLAAHNLDRVARLIEDDPRYCDVIVRRWQDHTGGTGRLNRRKKRLG